jgi:FkbM family methyltransferase
MFDKLTQLKVKGYYPDTIIDIGAHHGNWTKSMRQIFDSSNYYLFEAIDYPELKQINSANVYNVILNDTSREVDWYEMKNSGDSMFKEKTYHFNNCKIFKRHSIDLNTFAYQQKIFSNAKNILIKIDCQGAEIPILKGATDILHKTDFVVLEIPLFGQYNEGVPTFLEHISFMDGIGFVPYDILENHHINGFNMQVDMLFINKNHSFNTLVNEKLL